MKWERTSKNAISAQGAYGFYDVRLYTASEELEYVIDYHSRSSGSGSFRTLQAAVIRAEKIETDMLKEIENNNKAKAIRDAALDANESESNRQIEEFLKCQNKN